ncbi:MAG TPA: CHAT domain-containing protein [Acidobacteriota bacterium]|nr:CHAT domain-containing protein [Acidobacteriota bacterium]
MTAELDTQVATLNLLAKALLLAGQTSSSLEESERALVLARRARSPQAIGGAWYRVGEANYYLGRHLEAVEAYQESVAIWEGLGRTDELVRALIDLGYAQLDLSLIDAAFGSLDRAQEAAGQNALSKGRVRVARAHLHSRLGEKEAAARMYQAAIPSLRQEGDQVEVGRALSGLGFVYLSMGQPEVALSYYKDAAEAFAGAGSKVGRAGQWVKMGECHMMQDRTELAVQCYKRAYQVYRLAEDRRMESYTLRLLGEAYLELHDIGSALQFLRDAQEANRSPSDASRIVDPRDEAYILNALGQALRTQGDLPQALVHYQEALELSRRARDPLGEVVSLSNIAQSRLDLGKPELALDPIQNAIQLSESVRLRVMGFMLKSSFLDSVYRTRELEVETLMQMHAREPAKGFDHQALAASDRSRSQNFLEQLQVRATFSNSEVDSAQQSLEENLLRDLKGMISRLQRIPSDLPEVAGLNERIERALTKLDRVDAAANAPAQWHFRRDHQELDLSSIQQSLRGRDMMVLEYALGARESYLWTVTPQEVRSFILPPADEISEAVSRLLDHLARHRVDEEAGYRATANRLSRMLLSPVSHLIEDKSLLIVPDGVLHYLPFQALPIPAALEAGGSAPGGKGLPELLVHRHRIAMVSSLSTLAVLQKRVGRVTRPRSAAVYADPVFGLDDRRVGGQSDSPDSGTDESLGGRRAESGRPRAGAAPLPASRREAEQIATLLGPSNVHLALGLDANLEDVLNQDLGSFRYLHFATHAVLDEVHPDLSGLILSLVDAQGNAQDGYLRLHAISRMKIGADVVVLSACESALGREVKGLGVVSLVNGFFRAGAGRVVATLWKVDDAASQFLMGHFYSGMVNQGLPPSESLRQAQRKMLEHDRFRSPFYWAAFVLHGRMD